MIGATTDPAPGRTDRKRNAIDLNGVLGIAIPTNSPRQSSRPVVETRNNWW